MIVSLVIIKIIIMIKITVIVRMINYFKKIIFLMDSIRMAKKLMILRYY